MIKANLKLLFGIGSVSTSVGHQPYISQTDIDAFRSDFTHRPVLIPEKKNFVLHHQFQTICEVPSQG